MLVAHFRGSGSLCKVFGIDRIAPWVGRTHACNGALAGLAADFRGFYAVRNGKARVGLAFMDTVHDVTPYILVEGGASVVDIAVFQLLVAVTSAPDAGRIVWRITYEPDIVVSGCGAALAGSGHSGQRRPGTGGVDGNPGPCKQPVALHGFGHGVRKEECGGIL